jgi:HAD superfamily hydrolase (TIGR01450 family)
VCGTTPATAYDAGLFDLDGVVYLGATAIPHAADALAAARAAGLRAMFVTNNASRTPEQVVQVLAGAGVPAAEDDIVTSAQAAAVLLAAECPDGGPVLVVGGEGLRAAVTAAGFSVVASADDAPVAVAQGFDRSTGYDELAEATLAVRAGAVWVASNTDSTIPGPRGLLPGNGALVAAVSVATGATPLVAGKPDGALHAESVRRSQAQHPLVVGDRLDTDIEAAILGGTDSLLVLTGVCTLAQLLSAACTSRTPRSRCVRVRPPAEAFVRRSSATRWTCPERAGRRSFSALRALRAGRRSTRDPRRRHGSSVRRRARWRARQPPRSTDVRTARSSFHREGPFEDVGDAMVRESVKAYLALASGLTEVTRQRAVAAAQALAAQGEATMDQVATLADELLTSSLANREAVTALVRAEVERTIARVADANGDEVARLTAGLRSMEATLRETASWAADAVQEIVEARGRSGPDAAQTWADATSGQSAPRPAGAAAKSAATKTAGATKSAAPKPTGAARAAAKAAKESGTAAAKESGTAAAKKSSTAAAKKSGGAAKKSGGAAKPAATRSTAKKPVASKAAAKKPAARKAAAAKPARQQS